VIFAVAGRLEKYLLRWNWNPMTITWPESSPPGGHATAW